VRLWAGNTDSDSGKVEWGGKVQRVVDGESHQFSNLQELANLLEALASTNQKKQ